MPGELNQPTKEQLAPIQAFYDQGLFLQAWELARAHGPLPTWRGPEGRLLAGRLARHLGGGKIGFRQILLAWRHHPAHWQARAFLLWTLFDLRGPLTVWRRLDQFGEPGSDQGTAQADFWMIRGRAAAAFRDFEAADHCFDLADPFDAGRGWVTSERCERLVHEDRYEAALDLARAGLQLRPRHWSLVGQAAHALQLLGRDDEALTLLRETIGHVESVFLAQLLYALEFELGLHEAALRTIELIARRAPLGDQDFNEWLAGIRATCLYHLGRREEAVQWARQAGQADHWLRFTQRLENPPSGARRVQLPVGFVRQHHLTCVPATLTTLSRFWNQPAQHLEVAEAICYDGTASHSERNWAQQNGWATREFKVTLAAARCLLDRGVPFAITTVQPANAHEQAVIGYDDYRESLLLRDPYSRNRWEMLAERGLAAQAPHGPRGLAMVPAQETALFDGLELPEAGLYDLHHALLSALDRHDRTAARAAFDELTRQGPEHRLTLQARRALAVYDANPAEILPALEALLAQYPEEVNWHLGRLACLRDLAGRDERLAVLRAACARKDSDPLLWQELAWELAQDAREQANAVRWLDRAQRFRPTDSMALLIRGNIAWEQGRFSEGSQFYRFAACLQDKHERFAITWFGAARWLKETAAALGFLTRRFRRDGKRSSLPARTLVWAHLELDQPLAALAVLEEALAARPQDGALKLFAAEKYARAGDVPRAETLLHEARTQTSPSDWARAAASVASRRGATQEELDLWRQALEAEPLAMDAHRAVTFLLAETQGRPAALAHLAAACARFPYYFPLHQLRVGWTREEGAQALETVARALVTTNPEDAWARRELATALCGLRRFEEALAELDHAALLEPNHVSLFNGRGDCFARQGRRKEARGQFREALRRTVDDSFAMRSLLEQCLDAEERREELDFLQAELVRQTTFGEGILVFADLARAFLPAEKLEAVLRAAQQARPDLWQAWCALVMHLVALKRAREALPLAIEATQRFPLVPRLWLELGRVHRACLDHDQAIAALQKVREINPGWGFGMRELAGDLDAIGQVQEARAVMEQAIARSAQDPYNRGTLAAVLWKAGDKKAALSQVREAVLLEPGYDWAWARLTEWSGELDQPDAAKELAEELTRRRPGEPRSWWLLARTLPETALSDRLAALDRAVEQNPHFVGAWQLRARILARAGRYAEALQATRPEALRDPPPGELRATAAWIAAQQGDLPQAIRDMKATLADHPDLEWAWRELADWHSQRREFQAAADAAEALARLLPFDPMPLAYAADLKLQNNDKAGALADLRRAVGLDPAYAHAGFRLFDLYLEDGDLEQARATLTRLRSHLPEPALLARELELLVRSHPIIKDWILLRTLCTQTEDYFPAFDRVARVLGAHSLQHQAQPVVWELVKQPVVNPSTGWLWVELRWRSDKWNNLPQLLSLPEDQELTLRAWDRQLDGLGAWLTREDAGVFRRWRSSERHLQRLLRVRREWLRRHDLLWGKVGYALACAGRHQEVTEWLSDWQARSKVEPWMLDNLLIAYQQTGRDAEAAALIQEVRRRPRHSGGLVRFDLFHALHETCAGNPQPGRYLLATTLASQLDHYETALHTFLSVALDFLPESGPPALFDRDRKDRLLRSFHGVHRYRACRQTFWAIAQLISRQTRRKWPQWWAKWHLLG
jgi:tetratricopeptide (TPR) repeat protein